VALVMVLWTVAILATVTAVAAQAARSSAQVTANWRARTIGRAMAESGILAARTLLEDSLRAYATDASRRQAFLARITGDAASNAASPAGTPVLTDTLGSGAFAVVVVDVGTRLDVNDAGMEGLAELLRSVTTPAAAQETARRVDDALRGDREFSASPAREQRDSLAATLLGRTAPRRQRRPFETLDALREIPGVDTLALTLVASSLTVDGNGQLNRQGASSAVRAAAAGTLVDAATRLLLIARGWAPGQALTREIQAVYDLSPDGLRLVRWREQER
jgi:type II secretory pathway component PulK